MEVHLTTIIYDSLTSSTLAFIGVIIPFIGAYWIYKRNIKSNAELRIYEIGREITEVLHEMTDIQSPIGLTAYTYIDKNLHLVDEPNRDIAMSKLQKKVLSLFPEYDGLGLDDSERAMIAAAIVTERFESLVPYGVTWSGKGMAYSPYGVDITIDDKLFPFGTKLYRKWIDRFGYLYNDLWMCFQQKKFIKDVFSTKFPDADVYGWLNEMEKTIKKVRTLHAKLILQIQIIDNNVDEKNLNNNLTYCGFYIFLMGLVGRSRYRGE